MKKNMIANIVTIGGTTLMLGIAGLSLPLSLVILGGTCVGCGYLTLKDKED